MFKEEADDKPCMDHVKQKAELMSIHVAVTA